MDYFHQLGAKEEKELIPGIWVKLVNMEGVSVMHVRIEKGAVLPEHYHVHEQVTNIITGDLEMTVGGQTRICKPGDVITIPSNTPHSVRGITEVYAIDVFQPVREDYSHVATN